MITLEKVLDGSILDIGGGGEGIIGRLYGKQVTAIDNRQEELDEAPALCEKRLMDATNLLFADCSFDNVTAFYTFMYMTTEEQEKAVAEAHRVLKPGGKLYIWDCNIASAYPDPFRIDLEIRLPDEKIRTTYGVGKLDVQDIQSVKRMCLSVGLSLITEGTGRDGFYLELKKV